MAITLRGVTSNNGGGYNAASTTAPPSGTASGDLLILIVTQSKEGTAAVATPSGWTLKGSSTSGGGGGGGVASVFYKYAGASEGSVTVTPNTTANQTVRYYALTGGPTSGDPFDSTPVFGTTSSTTLSITSFTPSSGAVVLVEYGILYGSAAPATNSTPTSYTATGLCRVGNYQNSFGFYDLTFDGATASGTCSTTTSVTPAGYPNRTVAVAIKQGLTPVSTTDTAAATDSSSPSATSSTTDTASATETSAYTSGTATTDTASGTDSSLVRPITSDTASATDTSSLYQTQQVSTSDTAAASDASTFAISTTTTDTAAASDSSSSSATRSTSDTAAATDVSASGVNSQTSDSATASDASVLFAGVLISTSDSATASDSSTPPSSVGSTSDNATATDTSSVFVIRSTSDNATGSETSGSGAALSTTDTATATDTSQPINSATQNMGSDAAQGFDASAISSTQATSDSAAATDVSNVSTSRTTTDQAATTETSRINQTRTDSATATETSLVGQTRTDTNTSTSETSRINLPRTETAAATDSSSLGIFTSDSGSTATDTSNLAASVTSSETFTFVDTAGVTKPLSATPDIATATDQANVTILPRVTEDIIYYGPDDYQNRTFRIIAQDHFTREFVHWDLPIDNVTVKFSLSGPNLLSGSLSSEMDSIMSLDPPLIPNRTWLHLEEDGEIRASFILTPFIDEPGTQIRHIEAEGFSGYPHWIYYEGPSFTGVQVDPADMIRKLWDHIQSYTDGNLRVNVANTKTPVKLGEPPENVAFTTSDGVNVSFQAGPYVLNYWTVTNIGDEIDKLCKETPIEYLEFSYWNDEKSDVIHNIVLGYPRLGSRRNDLVFREGENLAQLLPSYQGTNDNYASEVIVIGAGTGQASIRAVASGRIGLLRKTNIIQNQDIYKKDRAQAIANFEFKRIAHSRFLIEYITIDTTHPNSLWGTFIPGDDIQVEATVPYVGLIKDWYRIISYDYDPYQKVATIYLSPSDSFTYGAENVDPYDQLPTAGFASLASQQDFSSLFQTNQATRSLSQLQAYCIQNVQQQGCTWFNNNVLNNGDCLMWAWINDQPVASNGGFPIIGFYKGPLDLLSQVKYTMIIGKTDYGHILTGDNIVLYASDGTIGQTTNSQSDQVYPNPYYIPDANSTPGELSLEQQAAQLILARMRSGLPINQDWSWTGEPFLVSQYNVTLYQKFRGYSNMPAQQFLSAIILGQIS